MAKSKWQVRVVVVDPKGNAVEFGTAVLPDKDSAQNAASDALNTAFVYEDDDVEAA